MATIDAVSGPPGARVPSPAKPTWLRANWGVLLAVAAPFVLAGCGKGKY